MTIKEFLRPNLFKIILIIILMILSVVLIGLQVLRCSWESGFLCDILEIPSTIIFFPNFFPTFGWNYLNLPIYIQIILSLIWIYILGCLFYWLYLRLRNREN